MFSCRRSLTDDADSRRSTIDLDATPVGESSNGYIGKFRVVLIDKRALRDLETLNHASQHVANFVSVPVGKFEVSAGRCGCVFCWNVGSQCQQKQCGLSETFSDDNDHDGAR